MVLTLVMVSLTEFVIATILLAVLVVVMFAFFMVTHSIVVIATILFALFTLVMFAFMMVPIPIACIAAVMSPATSHMIAVSMGGVVTFVLLSRIPTDNVLTFSKCEPNS